MPLSYKAEREQLHRMADHLRARAAELEESGVTRLSYHSLAEET